MVPASVRRQGGPDDADHREISGVSHQDLADMVGTYRETATRVLNDFQAEGLIELGRMRIRLVQPDGLAALAEE